MEETKEEFLERQYKKLEHPEDFEPISDDWITPEKRLTYVCLENYNHTAETDIFVLGVCCPFCGGQMECNEIDEI